MFRFTIRDVLWLTVVVALGVLLVVENRAKHRSEKECSNAAERAELAESLANRRLRGYERVFSSEGYGLDVSSPYSTKITAPNGDSWDVSGPTVFFRPKNEAKSPAILSHP